MLIAAASGAGGGPYLRGERWLAPGRQVTALTRQPRECLAATTDPAAAGLVAIGRAAFRNPLLLGGQAARLRMSCSTCHISGRGNPDFQFPDLSGSPGTADVTSSLMSSHRGNGVFDPRPIPDLALPGKVSRAVTDPALGRFVHGLITQEFDGFEPPPVAFAGLLAYLRALRACRPDTVEPITVNGAIADTGAAVNAAGQALVRGDRAAARLLIGGARMTLGAIDERYALNPVARSRPAIATLDRQLRALQSDVDGGRTTATRLSGWRFPPALAAQLRHDAPRSLFDPQILVKKIGEEQVPP